MSAVDFSAFLIYFRFNYNFFIIPTKHETCKYGSGPNSLTPISFDEKIHLVHIQLIVMW